MAASQSRFAKLLIVSLQVTFLIAACSGNFYDKFDIIWGNGRAKVLDNGNLLTVTLDKVSGSGFQSRNEYMYAKLDMQIKLVPGNSAGTVTAYYLKSEEEWSWDKSEGLRWDEIDFEFLGNVSGQPYVLHTNVFTKGKGNREQQFYLWFDPTTNFHTYSILWSPSHIVLSVDGIPIREFKNLERLGLPYLNKKAMRLYSSLWNADNWATQGGLVKIDWRQAPFRASYRNFNDRACCIWYGQSSSCGSFLPSAVASWYYSLLDTASQVQMRLKRSKYMIYDYCKDYKRFPQGPAQECYYNNQ